MKLVSLLSLAILAAIAITEIRVAHAAGVSWGSPFVVDDPTDIVVPNKWFVHIAADFNTASDFGLDDGIINGVQFQAVDEDIAGVLDTSLTDGPNFGAAAFPGGTGDADLDNLMNSHSWAPGDPATASITLEGLMPGADYQVQLIGVVDTRTCCSARAYEPDDGQGNFNTGVSYTRGDLSSVIGTFTADATTQTILWRSLGEAAGNNDPGLSGLVVTTNLPEPSGIGLGILAVCGVLVVARRHV